MRDLSLQFDTKLHGERERDRAATTHDAGSPSSHRRHPLRLPTTTHGAHRHSSAADIARVAAYLPQQRPAGLATLFVYKALLGPLVWARDALLYAAMVASK
jgi:hypothetical protein